MPPECFSARVKSARFHRLIDAAVGMTVSLSAIHKNDHSDKKKALGEPWLTGKWSR